MWALPATKAWEKHYLEGKCDDITGRFFRPRVSEEFYDTETDFHNIHNLIDAPDHQEKINELRKALRAKQLELFDSGLLPEAMRLRRAEAHNLTIYQMVRNPELYPLEKYLDYADLVLARDPAQLPVFVEGLKDPDEGIRYWAICGLFLLENHARSAQQEIEAALEDEADEVKLMAAWALHRLGNTEMADACLERLRQERSKLEKPDLKDNHFFESLRRWMSLKKPLDKSGASNATQEEAEVSIH